MWKCLRCSNATPPHCSRSTDPRRRQAGQACADPDARGRPRGGAMATVGGRSGLSPRRGRRGTVVQPTVPRLTFTLLADVTIHLRVRNAAGHHDEQEITVTCQPRGGPKSEWHPTIDRRPFVSGGVLHEKLVSARLPLGRNVCIAELTEESSGHIIHHDSEQGTWNDSDYTTAQVQHDGPWNGCWYVGGHTLYIGRADLRSSDLSPGSALYRANVLAGRRADIAALARSVAEHEHAHTSVLYKIYNRHGKEPVTALESLIRNDETTLIRDADTAIGTLEALLQGDSNHEAEVHQKLRVRWGGRSVTIFIAEGGDPPSYTATTIPDLSQAGDTAG